MKLIGDNDTSQGWNPGGPSEWELQAPNGDDLLVLLVTPSPWGGDFFYSRACHSREVDFLLPLNTHLVGRKELEA